MSNVILNFVLFVLRILFNIFLDIIYKQLIVTKVFLKINFKFFLY